MYKMKVKFQKNVQNGSVIYRLRLAFLYCQNMYVRDAQCNLTLITSVSLILSQMQSGSEVQCALVSGGQWKAKTEQLQT